MTTTAPRPALIDRIALTMYSVVLRALPPALKRQRGEEMRALFAEVWSDKRRQRGSTVAVVYAIRASGRAVAAALGARLYAPRNGAAVHARPWRGALQDIGYGLRAVRQQPSFALVVVATLGLAIGVCTTIFTMVRTIVVVPIPFERPEELAVVYARNTELGRQRAGVSAPDYTDLRAALGGPMALAAYRRTGAILATGGTATRMTAMRVDRHFFAVTGLPLQTGRHFTPREADGGDAVVIIGSGAWQARFASDPGILGRDIVLDGVPHAIIGVLDAAVEVGSLRNVELWLPMTVDADAQRDRRELSVLVRLAADGDLGALQARVAALSRNLEIAHPRTNQGWELSTLSLRESLVGTNGLRVLMLMSVAVVFVLMIACVNVANLMLARSGARERELAVRAALGAGRGRLARQLFTEGAVLALLAAAVGLGVARISFATLVQITSGRVPFFADLSIEPAVALFAFSVALVTPLVFGTLPVWRARDGALSARLGAGRGQSAGPRQMRRRAVLVGAQVSLAVVLLVVAGLAIRSVAALASIPLGFEPASVVTAQLDLGPIGGPDAVRRAQSELLDALESIPDISRAALVSHRPVIGGEPTSGFEIRGRAVDSESDVPWAAIVHASAAFYETIRMPLVRGRTPARDSGTDDLPVAVISQAAAERYWPGEDPIGQELRLTGREDSWRVVTGIVGDLRNPDADQPPEPHVYLPLEQTERAETAVLVRTHRGLIDIRQELARTLAHVAPGVPLDDVRTMEQVIRDDLAGDVATISLVVFFAIVATVLACAGVYGVIAYAVDRRLREIGVRIAVGATANRVVRLVLHQGMIPVAAGLGLGLTLGYLVSQLMTGAFYGIVAGDPPTFLGVAGLISSAAFLACLIPARRAARVDPATSLRTD